MFASVVMTTTYGVHIEDESNEHVVQAEEWQHGFNQGVQPGRFWVDYFPIRESCIDHQVKKQETLLTGFRHFLVQYIPSWVPGAQFQKLAARWRQNMYNARDRPFEFARESLVRLWTLPVLPRLNHTTTENWSYTTFGSHKHPGSFK